MLRDNWLFVSRTLMVWTLALSGPVRAAVPEFAEPALPALQPGDVILISLRCYVCKVISETTDSPFNHSGLVLGTDSKGTTLVAQSLGHATSIAVEAFIQQAGRHSPVRVRRAPELEALRVKDPVAFAARARQLLQYFAEHVDGAPFDDEYLWDNFGPDGREPLYCSEMVQKSLNQILDRPLETLPLDYQKRWDFWNKYFKGNVPQGAPGNSPATLAAASQLLTVYDGQTVSGL